MVTVMEGDMLQPDMGLKRQDLRILRAQINVVIHSASSIALLKSLKRLFGPIIDSTSRLARLALDFDQLECFVFISSAYANAYIPSQTDGLSGIKIQETIYQLQSMEAGKNENEELERELQDVQKTGTSSSYDSHNFPWDYAYAKHLTERLLTHAFAASDKRLLILRPSIIEPAQSFPYRQFCLPMSTPHIIFTAGIALTPSRTACFSSQFKDPYHQSTVDYVPVDVVVDRLLTHLAQGTTGPVHAVAGLARMSFEATWTRTTIHRRIPWAIQPRWTRQSWHSKLIHPLGRLYCTIGASFEFSEEKTLAVWQQLSDSERQGLHLFTDMDTLYHDHEHMRSDHIWTCMEHLTKRQQWARWMSKCLYRSLASFKS
ncbi:hypothetical protein N7448_007235 [Penicillium atrosanguineum]|nr:uncharacterized protein N7443_001738 [Penicillium atrosanguineum]KAJ5126456.1 hypothetical protein N7448_007235 [Penicillium atrosanguineum]KAJ5146655.1 hypothetical protein N7526_000007 [Penicillium atrosanguineum]KAJ5314854.1 hypothetical protein N7443_001738 [Penicillium atrosanguineum]